MVYIFNSKTCDGGAELKDILGNKCVSFSLFPNDYDYERVGYAASAQKRTHRGTRFFSFFEGEKNMSPFTSQKQIFFVYNTLLLGLLLLSQMID